MVLLPSGRSKDDVVHTSSVVVREERVGSIGRVLGRGSEIDRFVADREVLEVVAATRLDLEVPRMSPDGLLEVFDDFSGCDAQRSRIALETVELGDDYGGELVESAQELRREQRASQTHRQEEQRSSSIRLPPIRRRA